MAAGLAQRGRKRRALRPLPRADHVPAGGRARAGARVRRPRDGARGAAPKYLNTSRERDLPQGPPAVRHRPGARAGREERSDRGRGGLHRRARAAPGRDPGGRGDHGHGADARSSWRSWAGPRRGSSWLSTPTGPGRRRCCARRGSPRSATRAARGGDAGGHRSGGAASPTGGAEAFTERLERAIGMIEFQVRRVLADADLDTPAGRDSALEEARKLIAARTRTHRNARCAGPRGRGPARRARRLRAPPRGRSRLRGGRSVARPRARGSGRPGRASAGERRSRRSAPSWRCCLASGDLGPRVPGAAIRRAPLLAAVAAARDHLVDALRRSAGRAPRGRARRWPRSSPDVAMAAQEQRRGHRAGAAHELPPARAAPHRPRAAARGPRRPTTPRQRRAGRRAPAGDGARWTRDGTDGMRPTVSA